MEDRTIVTIESTSAIVESCATTLLETTILGWLHAKSQKSHSSKTEQAYRDVLLQFRGMLQSDGLDLDALEDIVRVRFIIQAFASRSLRAGKQVAPATANQRMAILSSFYTYACGTRLVSINPTDGMERARCDAYAGARPIGNDRVAQAFVKIDQGTLQGKRDYALLALGLSTGRRVQELATLQIRHLTPLARQVNVSFERCKGGKQKNDDLAVAPSAALMRWLKAFYGEALIIGAPGDTRPVFVSLANGGRAGKSYGQQISSQAIADVCMKHLGTSKVHSMRHEFAHTMEAQKATTSEIQEKLGHASLATTGIYLAKLGQATNKYGDQLAAAFGIE